MKKATSNARIILATNIKKYRKMNALSQEELAYKAGLHRTYISSVERCERNVSIDAIEKLANALNVSIYKLLEK